MMTGAQNSRQFTNDDFEHAYKKLILGNNFFEEPDYYVREKPRYRRTVEYIASLNLPPNARILEIGGGQIGLLMSHLFGDRCTLGDVNDKYSSAVTQFGIEFTCCDLMHDDLTARDEFDLVILCEVIEHFPVPPHIILAKIYKWIKPGGHLFLTTPNLYRLRNVVRLALGMPVFCNFFYPNPGSPIGHPIEYSPSHLKWQVETAGFTVAKLEQVQLSNSGATMKARIARALLFPLMLLVPRWRDSLICASLRHIKT